MKRLILSLIIIGIFNLAMVAASKRGSTAKKSYKPSQNDIDMSTTPAKLGITGTSLGNLSIAHDGKEISPDSSIRDSYTNMSSAKEAIKPGTIFTKKVYERKKDGSKGKLLMIFAMIKREKGYDDKGGDWEYATLSFDKNTDFKKNPNGIFPSVSDNITRGKILYCGQCHLYASGKDFVFSN